MNPGQPYGAGAAWPDVSTPQGLDQAWSQFTVSIGDLDDDGRLDVLQRFQFGVTAPNGAAIFQNLNSTDDGWLKFKTEGRRSNRDGLGTRVTLHAGGNLSLIHI